MQRETCLLRLKPGTQAELYELCRNMPEPARRARARSGEENASAWRVGDLVFFYREMPREEAPLSEEDRSALADWEEALLRTADYIARPGTMRRMYTCMGIVRKDKSEIRHRVFATRLKPGCAEEYRSRHAALEDARGDQVVDTKESNFTIWNAEDYIFGYCELVKALVRPETEEERVATIAWETRQLGIMDWLTDDVDWLTGQSHEKVERIV